MSSTRRSTRGTGSSATNRHNGRDAVYGIDQSLTHLVDIFKSASRNYGTERRVILLHGPVGSAKSTIVRLLKKGPGGILAHA